MPHPSWSPGSLTGAYEVMLDVLSANTGPCASNVHMLPDRVGDREPEGARAVQALTSRRFPRHHRQTSPQITPGIMQMRVILLP